MQNNKISVSISAADKQAVLKNVAALQNQLKSVLIFNLTAEDRKGMAKMGERMATFTSKSLTYAGQNQSLIPAFMSLDKANKDFALAMDLAEIHKKLSTLLTALEDTMMIAGAEAHESGLIFYNAVKGASRSSIPGTKAIQEDLAAHFPRSKFTKNPKTTD
ncbi:hypothetical protein GWC95_01030 [Sediminibacterium roseum]|uniref:Uncharacterized protein n=1 Tax=Sediminibacterium roseum TaxID=1978412 RepID=A0ABW9ZTS7_9BACT|nr:hypothetical protein [Sediminibacterium roseum]NCI48485.1 hypothetical protein [Sediminibacterium roseum]